MCRLHTSGCKTSPCSPKVKSCRSEEAGRAHSRTLSVSTDDVRMPNKRLGALFEWSPQIGQKSAFVRSSARLSAADSQRFYPNQLPPLPPALNCLPLAAKRNSAALEILQVYLNGDLSSQLDLIALTVNVIPTKKRVKDCGCNATGGGAKKMKWQHQVYWFFPAQCFLQLLRSLGLCIWKTLNFDTKFLHFSRPSPLLYCSWKLHNDMESLYYQSLRDWLCLRMPNGEISIKSTMSCESFFSTLRVSIEYFFRRCIWKLTIVFFKRYRLCGLWNTYTERKEDQNTSVFQSLQLKTFLVLWIWQR